jgi:hypothetical protein
VFTIASPLTTGVLHRHHRSVQGRQPPSENQSRFVIIPDKNISELRGTDEFGSQVSAHIAMTRASHMFCPPSRPPRGRLSIHRRTRNMLELPVSPASPKPQRFLPTVRTRRLSRTTWLPSLSLSLALVLYASAAHSSSASIQTLRPSTSQTQVGPTMPPSSRIPVLRLRSTDTTTRTPLAWTLRG